MKCLLTQIRRYHLDGIDYDSDDEWDHGLDDELTKAAHSKLYAVALTAMGLSRVQVCRAKDSITLTDATKLLPTGLQELQLVYTHSYEPEYERTDIWLSDFSRFSSLRKLCLDIPARHKYEFHVNHQMPQLRHLEVHGAPLIFNGDRPIFELLPVIECLRVTVDYSQEDDSAQLAQTLLHHVSVLGLKFTCISNKGAVDTGYHRSRCAPCGPAPRKYNPQILKLTVEEASPLQKLQIFGNYAVAVVLNMKKLVKVQKNNYVNMEML